jgi:hypothetical protein
MERRGKMQGGREMEGEFIVVEEAVASTWRGCCDQ